ncbi:site-2 protease family protein [Methanothermococcus okinawensis]|uniref:site-2 protease family protein n=1 Tax=Methanothermococcus okinawensis TaxID=155863 RepID=UPI00064FE309|nr:site-2 protease family protein [Methanothermococcus okinawensis]
MEISSLKVILLFALLWTILYVVYGNRPNNSNTGLKTYYGIFGILRTSLGIKTISKLGKYKIWQKISILLIPICIAVSIITFYMLVNSTIQLFNGTVPKETSKPIIFLFGNTIPWIPGILALVIGITFHELAHGIVARSFNLNIKSTGLLLALGIPLGAFVEMGDDFKNASKKVRGAVASAGPVANIIIFLMALFITPYFYGAPTSLTITQVLPDHPANGVLMKGDILYSIDEKRINSLSEFYNSVKGIKPNENIKISILRNNELKTVELTTSKDGKIGIIAEPSKNLLFVLQTLYWTSMLNLMLGFFNLLPALPLDGFHVWNALPELMRDIKRNSKKLKRISEYMEYLINEKNLASISLMVWMIIFASVIYSFV